MDLVRLGLERARSADEALTVLTTLLERHGQGGSGEPHRDEPYFSSFLLADPDAGFVVETSNRTWAARPIGGGAAISNRVSLTTDWTRASSNIAADVDFDTYRRPRMPTAIADHRLELTSATVARGNATTVVDVARTLRSHGEGRSADELPDDIGPDGNGFTVCMHRRESHSQTTASMIAELRKATPPRAWVCLGNPCSGVYVPCFPPAIAPELAEPDQWRRFSRLRNRVEAVPGVGVDVLHDLRVTRPVPGVVGPESVDHVLPERLAHQPVEDRVAVGVGVERVAGLRQFVVARERDRLTRQLRPQRAFDALLIDVQRGGQLDVAGRAPGRRRDSAALPA